MPKGPGRPWKARKEPITDHYIQASVERGMNDATGHYGELVVNELADNAEALEMKRSLYRCAKYLGFSMHAEIEKLADGYQVRFKAIDKARARAFVIQKYGGVENLPYNPYQKNPPKEKN
jgi:hypothetical protein